MPESNSIEFTRIYDLFRQQPNMNVGSKILVDHTQKSGLLERYEVPSYISC